MKLYTTVAKWFEYVMLTSLEAVCKSLGPFGINLLVVNTGMLRDWAGDSTSEFKVLLRSAMYKFLAKLKVKSTAI